jgi:hypothetical protein
MREQLTALARDTLSATVLGPGRLPIVQPAAPGGCRSRRASSKAPPALVSIRPGKIIETWRISLRLLSGRHIFFILATAHR